MKTQNSGRASAFISFQWMNQMHRGEMLDVYSLALKSYRENRENGEPIDNPKRPFPAAGLDTLDFQNSIALVPLMSQWPDSQARYWWRVKLNTGQVMNDFYWMEDNVRGYPDKSNKNRYWYTVHHAPSGIKMEGFSQEPEDEDYWYSIQFTDTHCPAIAQWMKEKDLRYSARVGDFTAKLQLAQRYDIGDDVVEKNTTEAIFWYGKAAKAVKLSSELVKEEDADAQALNNDCDNTQAEIPISSCIVPAPSSASSEWLLDRSPCHFLGWTGKPWVALSNEVYPAPSTHERQQMMNRAKQTFDILFAQALEGKNIEELLPPVLNTYLHEGLILIKEGILAPNDWIEELNFLQFQAQRVGEITATQVLFVLVEQLTQKKTIDLSSYIGATCKVLSKERTLEGHNKGVWSLTPLSGSLLASGSTDGTIKIWNTNSERCLHTLQGDSGGAIWSLVELPGGLLASGSDDGTIEIWDTSRWNFVHMLEGHSDTVYSLNILPRGLLASGSGDGTIKIWDINSWHCLQTLQGHHGYVRSVVPISEELLASGSHDSTIKIWDMNSWKCVQTLREHTGNIYSLIILSEGRLLASSSEDYTIRIWDTISWRCVQILRRHDNFVQSLSLIPGELLVSGSGDDTIRIWDTNSWSCIQTLQGGSYLITSLTFLPGGKLASGSYHGGIKIWNFPDARSAPEADLLSDGSMTKNVFDTEEGKLFVSSAGRLRSGIFAYFDRLQNCIREALWAMPLIKYEVETPLKQNPIWPLTHSHLEGIKISNIRLRQNTRLLSSDPKAAYDTQLMASKSSYCFQIMWPNIDKTWIPALKCRENDLSIFVFPKISAETALSTQNAGELSYLKSDHYSVKACKIVGFDEQSKIYCEGKKTTLLTVSRRQAPTGLEQAASLFMLSVVSYQIVKDVLGWVKDVYENLQRPVSPSKQAEQYEQLAMLKHQQQRLNKKLNMLEKEMGKKIKWCRFGLEELGYDIEDLESHIENGVAKAQQFVELDAFLNELSIEVDNASKECDTVIHMNSSVVVKKQQFLYHDSLFCRQDEQLFINQKPCGMHIEKNGSSCRNLGM